MFVIPAKAGIPQPCPESKARFLLPQERRRGDDERGLPLKQCAGGGEGDDLRFFGEGGAGYGEARLGFGGARAKLGEERAELAEAGAVAGVGVEHGQDDLGAERLDDLGGVGGGESGDAAGGDGDDVRRAEFVEFALREEPGGVAEVAEGESVDLGGVHGVPALRLSLGGAARGADAPDVHAGGLVFAGAVEDDSDAFDLRRGGVEGVVAAEGYDVGAGLRRRDAESGFGGVGVGDERGAGAPHAHRGVSQPRDVHGLMLSRWGRQAAASTRCRARQTPRPFGGRGPVPPVIPAKAGISQPWLERRRGSCFRRNDERKRGNDGRKRAAARVKPPAPSGLPPTPVGGVLSHPLHVCGEGRAQRGVG